ncbi:MAG: kelch repeat-containing protein [Candidatus Eisenbacteria bacterium]
MRESRHAARFLSAVALALALLIPAGNALAQTPKWIKLPPPATVGVHVYDSLRDRELFLDEAGIVAASDAPQIGWERVWIGVNPVLTGNVFAFYDRARDRIWMTTTTVGFSTPTQLWYLELSADPMQWTPQATSGSFPDALSSGITASSFAFDPVRDRLLAFGGATTCNACYSAYNSVWSLSLAGTPDWSTLTVAGTPPGIRHSAAMVYDPWRDRMVVYGGNYWPGFGSGTWYDDAFGLSLAAPMTWLPMTAFPDPPTGRIPGPALLDSLGRRVIILGQTPSSGTPQSDILTLDLSAGVSADQAVWGTLPSGPSTQAALFLQPVQSRIVSYDGTDQWNLLLGSTPAWNLVGGGLAGPLKRRGMVSFVDAERQRVYAGLGGTGSGAGTDAVLLVRPFTQEVPWVTLSATGPGPRYGAVGVADPAGDRALVFGGAAALGTNDTDEYADLWSFDFGANTWTPLAPATSPQVRAEALGVFDTQHRRLIVHGGRLTNPSPIARSDTWIYDVAAGTWSSPAVGSYGGVWGEVGVYDALRDRVVALGPNLAQPIHVLPLGPSLGSWTAVTPAGTAPNALAEAAVYDSLHDRVLVAGVTGASISFWALSLSDPPTWSPMLASGVPPAARSGFALALDKARERVLMFGGAPFSGPLPGDTWAFYFDEAATPTQLALITADATSDHVTLRWYAGGLGSIAATVYRRAPDEDWRALGQQDADGTGVIEWIDRNVISGFDYDYRLGIPTATGERFYGEARVSVPGRSGLALAGMRPNPSDGPMLVSFALESSEPATLELLDLAGRRVLSREVGSLGAGTHAVRLDGDAPAAAAGLYFIRLTQGGRSISTRLVLAR